MMLESIARALEQLRARRAGVDKAIEALEALQGLAVEIDATPAANGNGNGAAKRVGRPPKAEKAPAATEKSAKAPRGLLQKHVQSILRKARKPLPILKIRDAVVGTGYPASDPQTLYTSIYLSLKRMQGAKKSKEGWVLTPAKAKAAK